MNLTQKNTKTLENLVEISHMLLADTRFQEEHPDSVEARRAAIEAALAFDTVEARLLRVSKNDWNYEWMDATEAYVDLILDTETKPKEAARMAIVGAGLHL